MEIELEKIFQKYELNRDQYETFRDRFTLRQFRAGDTVFTEGDLAETFYFIRSGELTVSRLSGDRQEKVLKVLGPGELFGEVGLLQDTPRMLPSRRLPMPAFMNCTRLIFLSCSSAIPPSRHCSTSCVPCGCCRASLCFASWMMKRCSKSGKQLTLKHYQAGETLVSEGDTQDAMYLVIKGNARTFTTGPEGGEVTTGYMRPGSHAGTRGLTERCSHEYSVDIEDSAEVFVLEKKDFRRLLRRHPGISFSLPESGLLNTVLPFFHGREAYLTIPTLAMNRPGKVNWLMGIITLVLVLAAALPTLFPAWVPFLHPLVVDTDPENMLAADESSRVFHNRLKSEMTLHDIMVVGVVNDKHPEGVFNSRSLGRVFELSEFAKTLAWEDEEHPGEIVGVLAADMMSPSTMDIVEQAGAGTVRFSWLMPEPPGSDAVAKEIRRKLKRYPTMDGILISEDGGPSVFICR